MRDMMTIKDICEFLSVSDTTAYRFVNEAPIVCVRVGREYKISRKSLAEYLNCDLEVS